MKILAVDPGKVTGLALWDSREGLVRSWQDADFLSTCWELEDKTRICHLVVCEAFIISPQTVRKSQQTISLELIGVARWVTGRSGTEFVLQQPAEAKRAAPDARLKKIGWYTPGPDHARDAARHLLLALLKRGLLDPATLI